MGHPSKCPAEFRTEAVELVRTAGRPRAEIARSLGLSDSTLKNWLVEDRVDSVWASEPAALAEDEHAEFARCVGTTWSCGPTGRSCGRLQCFRPGDGR